MCKFYPGLFHFGVHFVKSTTKILTGIAFILSGLPAGAALEDDFDEALIERCEQYQTLNRENLQAELEDLLLNAPDDACISFIVALLGTPPVAQAPEEDDERRPDSAVFVTSTLPEPDNDSDDPGFDLY